jgi:hypothetical protein
MTPFLPLRHNPAPSQELAFYVVELTFSRHPDDFGPSPLKTFCDHRSADAPMPPNLYGDNVFWGE